jgi:two-component system response regulator
MSDPGILLVEDNPDDVELMVRALRSEQVQAPVTVAVDGTEALGMLCGSEGRPAPGVLPAVVLLDLKLPGIDGFEVLRRIRGHPATRHLPVVILTSSTEPADLVRAYEVGANSYVRKPTAFHDLVTAARRIAEYWLRLNLLPLPPR